MSHRILSPCVIAILLTGCAAGGPMPQSGRPVGYLYQDANHPNGTSQASPEAIYSATHGTWLWPPANNVMND